MFSGAAGAAGSLGGAFRSLGGADGSPARRLVSGFQVALSANGSLAIMRLIVANTGFRQLGKSN